MSDKSGYPRTSNRLESVRQKLNLDGKSELCAWKGCDAAGKFKAPSGRYALRDYIWFCLDHVREYNLQWDYFAGMNADEIERHRRHDATWHRPTWQLGSNTHHGQPQWGDPFGIFGDYWPQGTDKKEPPADAKTLAMMNVLELPQNYSEADLKNQYKLMAKRHHPDLHGGDKIAEERLKRVNEAYTHLKKQFS